MNFLEQSFHIRYEYKVFFTEGLFDTDNLTLANFFRAQPSTVKKKVLFVLDAGLLEANPSLKTAITAYFQVHTDVQLAGELLIVPGAEAAKNDPEAFERIIDAVNTEGIDRHSYIAAVGGGAVLDLVGYAAAVAHRGIRHIRIPSTVLSQNDSGIGVKNGINYKGKKNFIGSFAPPAAVFNDKRFLLSLNNRDFRSGIAEAIKVALIKDAAFFSWMEEHAHLLLNRDMDSIDYLIKRCAQLHMEHIAGADPFEMGSSRPLDFGHWSAHKLEQLSNFSITHGEAVAMGMALDSTYSLHAGVLTEEKLQRILNLLAIFFDITHPLIRITDLKAPILDGLTEFREHLGGKLCITLLRDIGVGFEVNEMDLHTLLQSSQYILQFKMFQFKTNTLH
ncbi:3-dehydroquinate synthase [Pedobacter sp. SAFR-022]|uniref:3-dehydroquinate synthase n=1 Tax=Pedobacter sp. SAFR-022 TaxID=3436861 RepID=UPI003F7E3647